MSQNSPAEERVEQALASFNYFNGRSVTYQTAFPPILMPMHLSIDGITYIVNAQKPAEMCFLKLFSDDMIGGIGFSDTVAASKQAHSCGIAPEVLDYSKETVAILYKHLGQDWRPSLVSDLEDKDIRANSLAAKRLWHKEGDVPENITLFETVSNLKKQIEDDCIAGQPIKKPHGYRTMADWVDRITKILKAVGIPPSPLHAENTVANVMIGPDKKVNLVDFDRVCAGDPMYDLGAFCLEYCHFDYQLYEAVEIYNGSFDEKLFNRCKLYMIIDDFLWGCWGKISHYTSPRCTEIEFYKYGEVRFLRCLHNINAWDIDTLTRRI